MRYILIFLLLCPWSFGSSLELIDEAYQQGRISIYDKALLTATYILDNSSLPPAFSSPVTQQRPCATPLLMEVASILRHAPPAYRSRYQALKARPSYDGKEHRFLSSQGHFYIHYTGSGEHAPDMTDADMNGVPDQVETMADLFELSHTTYHQQLGYLLPPSDGTLGGGQDIYDVYIQNWPGYYGYSMPEDYAGDMPEYATRSITHIGISNWVTGIYLRGTVAHEYYHACQMAYYCDYLAYSSWAWDENTAMYTEELVFPDDDTWLDYTGYRQKHTFFGLWLFDGWTEYCNVIWPLYIREGLVAYDDTFFRTVFAELGLLTTPQAGGFYPLVLDQQLGSWAGYTLADAYQEFTLWNYMVKDCYDGTGYEDGASFNQLPRAHQVLTYQDLPFCGTGDPTYTNELPPETFASHYIEIYPEANGPGALLATFTGEAAKNQVWGYSLLCHDRGQPLTSGWALHDQGRSHRAGTSHILLPTPSRFDRVVLIFDNLQRMEEPTGRNYSYTVELSNRVQVAAVTPDSGSVNGGDTVTIKGANFDQGTEVWFDKIPAPVVTVIDDTQVVVQTPAHAPGPATVVVRTMLHGRIRLPNGFVFY